MHVLQPGEKRSAEEGMPDAGGKRAKMSAEGAKKPPLLCANYRRDVASFLPRAQIQHWRQTSKFSNAALSRYPHRLPRAKYHALIMNFTTAGRFAVKRDGFLRRGRRNIHTLPGTLRQFNRVYQFKLCCRDVKRRAKDTLIGQRLFPGQPDDEGVVLQLHVDGGLQPNVVICAVPKRLTNETAPVMLHFLHHASQACFDHVGIYGTRAAAAAEVEYALNPLVLDCLPKFQLRGIKFDTQFTDLGELRTALAISAQMHIRFNAFCPTGGRPLRQLLDLIASGRRFGKRLQAEGRFPTSLNIDYMVKYFVEHLRSLEETIRVVRIEMGATMGPSWPAKCPREAPTAQTTRNADGTVDYRFAFVNAHSGEVFSLWLLGTSESTSGDFFAREFRLNFGTA